MRPTYLINLDDLNLTAEELALAQGQDRLEPMMLAAQCAWEHCLAVQTKVQADNATLSQHDDILSDMLEGQGSFEMREKCMALAHAINIGWAIMSDDGQGAMGSFDWTYVPWFMEHCVNWENGGELVYNWTRVVREKDQSLIQPKTCEVEPVRLKRLYRATVHLLLEAESEAEACDAVSGALTENLESNGMIEDWGYVRMLNGQCASPVEIHAPQGMPEDGWDLDAVAICDKQGRA